MNNLFNQPQETSTQVVEDVTEPKVTTNYLANLSDKSIKIDVKGEISFPNCEELYNEIDVTTAKFKGLVIENMTDEEFIKNKELRAELNSKLTLIDKVRLATDKEFKEPLNEFNKQKINPIKELLKSRLADMDKNLNNHKQKLLDAKKLAIEEFYNKCLKEYPKVNFISLDTMSDTKWYNVGTTLKKINEEILGYFKRFSDELKSIEFMNHSGDIKVEWISNGFDLPLAQETVLRRIKKVKEEQVRIDKINADKGLVVNNETVKLPKEETATVEFISRGANMYTDNVESPIEETVTDGSQKEVIAVFAVKGGIDDIKAMVKLMRDKQLEVTNVHSVSDFTNFMEENK